MSFFVLFVFFVAILFVIHPARRCCAAGGPPRLRAAVRHGVRHRQDANHERLLARQRRRSPELRHEVPLTVPDPFLYAERDGARHVFVGSLEVSRIRDLDS